MRNGRTMTEHRNIKADTLLQHVQRYQSGRLTVFLGAAPGVGKTYAMLMRARDLHQQGQDIVIGYVEAHGRTETESLRDGLSEIQLKQISYQGHSLVEMDIDAILKRKPAIVLVDEFAHQNVPGSRHSKRWQDVNELLDAGIDVFTTMNIQHLESLNDVVYQITGVRVKETVPDRVLERIRDIRLIDLPVNELLERLNQGKVYVPEQTAQALQGFFNISNLTALRELAIQTVAGYVDVDVRENFMVQGQMPVPLNNHVLILLDEAVQPEAMVRAGCRLAEKRAAQWTVVAFAADKLNGSAHVKAVDDAFNLARQMGGMTETLYGQEKARILNDFAVTKGIATLMLPQQKTTVLNHLNPSIAQQLMKKQPSYELSIVPVRQKDRSADKQHLKGPFLSVKESLFVVLTTCVSIAIAWVGEYFLGIEELSVIFITAVVFVASKTRMLAAVSSALLFFLAYNFFFISPEFTLQISAHQGVVTVIAFLAAALIASRLASRLREQVVALKTANSHNSIMQDLGQKLSMAVNLEQVIQHGQQSLEQHLHAQIWISLSDSTEAGSDLSLLTEKEKISAEWTRKNHQPSGRFTQTLMENEWMFLPLLTSRESLGVAGIKYPATVSALNSEQKHLMESMVDYIAQAVYRTQLTKELEIANVNSETEKLRSALLSSVSHDLRSPLASMIGSADTLMHYRQNMNDEDQNSLLQAIHIEGERLDRYIQNLLDMTRLGHEGLSLKRDWIGADELVGSAVRRLKRYMPETLVSVILPAEPVSLFVHAALIEQAVFNVLENAAKFSPQGVPVEVEVLQLNQEQVQIVISDQGEGIPEDERNRIFDMFYTMQRGDRGQYGTGLGLTIVKAIVGAHMGQISAESAQNSKGTCIRMTLPISHGA
jgi:two-component system sensor histidine kinase KdpD